MQVEGGQLRGEVAPHWGAWIEMRSNDCASSGHAVAPHWGAWIEIPLGE